MKAGRRKISELDKAKVREAKAREREEAQQAKAGEREMILGWYQKWGLTAVPLGVAHFEQEGAE